MKFDDSNREQRILLLAYKSIACIDEMAHALHLEEDDRETAYLTIMTMMTRWQAILQIAGGTAELAHERLAGLSKSEVRRMSEDGFQAVIADISKRIHGRDEMVGQMIAKEESVVH